MNIKWLFILIVGICMSCDKNNKSLDVHPIAISKEVPYITILGVAQDGGFPHINNNKEFETVAIDPDKQKRVSCLGLLDYKHQKKFLFDATPDLPVQLSTLERSHFKSDKIIDGIFLTHAHMGHYTGLMHLGREAMGSKNIKVMAMPRMKEFLETNGPWDQLSTLHNIKLLPLGNEVPVQVTPQLTVIPFIVPHRDEYSETVGYKIIGPNKSALYIPDIDKWTAWDKDIVAQVQQVDYAFLDATFFANGEIPRPMSDVPHPFVEETVNAFAKAEKATKSKIIFIHLNHSNPALDPNFNGRKELEAQGFNFAKRDATYML